MTVPSFGQSARSGATLLLACTLGGAHCSAHRPASRTVATTPAQALAPSPDEVAEAPPSAEARFVDALLSRMTDAEKLGQLNQLSSASAATGPGAVELQLEQVRRGEVGSLLNIVGASATRALQRVAVESSRLHIPLLFAYDAIHGLRTIFPVPLAEASSWNPAAAEQSARVAASESAAHGLQWTFAPMVDIARDPRWGRVVEGAGEDPVLGSAFAAARVRGFQGPDLRAPTSVAATAKHFVGYGAAEAGRDYNHAEISDRALREVYLPPFHAAVCAGAQTLMAAFSDIAGTPAHAHRPLLGGVLRTEWGFDGLVVSDWDGVNELVAHGVASDRVQAGLRALRAGVDVDMASRVYAELGESVRTGRLDRAEVDIAVRRVLGLKYRLGLFDDPYRGGVATLEGTEPLAPAHRTLAREIARQSVVLLQNARGLLPLERARVRTLAVIGALASDARSALGPWAGRGRPEDAVTVLDGVRSAMPQGARVLYARGASPDSDASAEIAAAVRTARRADVVVLVVGETAAMSGEAHSRTTLDLPGAQQQLAEAVIATGKPVVAVLMNGRPLSTGWLHEHAGAVLESWFLGVEHGAAVADVLFGIADPSGRLPVSVPRNVGQVPIYHSRTATARPPREGASYTSRYLDVPITPLYPFGYGLGYTSFRYGAPRLSAEVLHPGETLSVDVAVSNTGARAGTTVVQLYLRDELASVTRPMLQLAAFERVELAAGQTRTVHFELSEQQLALYDSALRRVVEPGRFRVLVGGNAAEVQEAGFAFATRDGEPLATPLRCAGAQASGGSESRATAR